MITIDSEDNQAVCRQFEYIARSPGFVSEMRTIHTWLFMKFGIAVDKKTRTGLFGILEGYGLSRNECGTTHDIVYIRITVTSLKSFLNRNSGRSL